MCQLFQVDAGRKSNYHNKAHLCIHPALSNRIQTSTFYTIGPGCSQVFQFQVPMNPK